MFAVRPKVPLRVGEANPREGRPREATRAVRDMRREFLDELEQVASRQVEAFATHSVDSSRVRRITMTGFVRCICVYMHLFIGCFRKLRDTIDVCGVRWGGCACRGVVLCLAERCDRERQMCHALDVLGSGWVVGVRVEEAERKSGIFALHNLRALHE